MEEALCLAMGWPVLNQFKVTAPKRVLFIEEEDEPAKVNERARALIMQHGGDPDELAEHPGVAFLVQQNFKADSEEWLDRLRRIIERHQVEVVYVEALWRMTAKPSLERADDILAAVEGVTRVNQQLGTAFRVIHHATKRTGRVASGRDLPGGPTLRGWAQSSLMFGESARGVTTISYEGKGGFSGPVCRLRVLATEPAPGERSLFTGLEWLPLRGDVGQPGQPGQSAPAAISLVSQRHQQIIAALAHEEVHARQHREVRARRVRRRPGEGREERRLAPSSARRGRADTNLVST